MANGVTIPTSFCVAGVVESKPIISACASHLVFLGMVIVLTFNLMGTATAGIGQAGRENSSPTQIEAWLAAECGLKDTTEIERQVLLGAVAFNSPYLYGGAALRDFITCVACHGANGRSGPALTMRFDKPISDILNRHWEQDARAAVMPDAFIRSAIVHEFSGPPPSENLVHAIAAYLRQIEGSRKAPNSKRFNAGMLAGVTILVLRYDLNHQRSDYTDFLIESARFAIGQATAESDTIFRPQFIEFNRQLKELGRQFDLGLNLEHLREIDRLLASIETELLDGCKLIVKDP